MDKYNRSGSRNLVSLVQARVDDPRDGVWVQGGAGKGDSGGSERSPQGVAGPLSETPLILEGHEGRLCPIPESGLVLDPRVHHATSPEACSERKVLVGYLPHATRKLSMRDQLRLAKLGFVLP